MASHHDVLERGHESRAQQRMSRPFTWSQVVLPLSVNLGLLVRAFHLLVSINVAFSTSIRKCDASIVIYSSCDPTTTPFDIDV